MSEAYQTTTPVTLNLFQGPSLGLRRSVVWQQGRANGVFRQGSAHAAGWMLKQVQHDECNGRGSDMIILWKLVYGVCLIGLAVSTYMLIFLGSIALLYHAWLMGGSFLAGGFALLLAGERSLKFVDRWISARFKSTGAR